MPPEMKIVPDATDYLAASDGTVWRLKGNTLSPVKAHRLKNGYLAVNVRKGPGDWVTRYVHHLVALAWLPPPLPGQTVVRHLDGNKDNCTPQNLARGDSRMNAEDCKRHGRTMTGEKNPAAKLNLQIAYAMREAVKMGVKQGDVARHFRVSPGTVSDVVNERRWMPEAAMAP
jgi:hypothetical protein